MLAETHVNVNQKKKKKELNQVTTRVMLIIRCQSVTLAIKNGIKAYAYATIIMVKRDFFVCNFMLSGTFLLHYASLCRNMT